MIARVVLRLAPPHLGESHSPVVHELWVLVVAGSNPASPTGPDGPFGDSGFSKGLLRRPRVKSRLPDLDFISSFSGHFRRTDDPLQSDRRTVSVFATKSMSSHSRAIISP